MVEGPVQASVPQHMADPSQAKPIIRLMNKALKAKLPRMFSRGKTIESQSTIKIKHKKVKYW